MNSRFEELIGRYWDIAFSEGETGVSCGDEANEVLHELRKLAVSLPPDDERSRSHYQIGDRVRYTAAECPDGWLMRIVAMKGGLLFLCTPHGTGVMIGFAWTGRFCSNLTDDERRRLADLEDDARRENITLYKLPQELQTKLDER